MVTLFVWNIIKTGAICFVIATVYAGLTGRMTEWFEYLGLAPTSRKDKRYTVWIGGIQDVEGVDYETALEVHQEWINKGYDDSVIEEED